MPSAPLPRDDTSSIAASSVLRTARLRLRDLRMTDAPRLQRYASDLETARMLVGVPHPYPEGQAKRFIRKVVGSRIDEGRFRAFAIERLNGFIGVVSLSWDKVVPNVVTLSYALGRPHWGKGYATEAVAAVIRRSVLATEPTATIGAGVFFDNPASARVLTKLGFRPIEERSCYCEARGAEVPLTFYVLAPDGSEGTTDEISRSGEGLGESR